MKYIVTSPNECRPIGEMEKPNGSGHNNNGFAIAMWALADAEYQSYVKSLPRYPIIGENNYKVGMILYLEDHNPEICGCENHQDYCPFNIDAIYVPDNEKTLKFYCMEPPVCKNCSSSFELCDCGSWDPLYPDDVRPIAEKEDKPDCAGHKKDLFGHSDMKEVAEAIGDLHYEELAELFLQLKRKFSMDAENDLTGNRVRLSQQLENIADACYIAERGARNAYLISKQFMEKKLIN